MGDKDERERELRDRIVSLMQAPEPSSKKHTP
jgi:hypothetical protein